ncbi:MAG: putative integrase/recombinase [Actinomycetia bacterium]|nr:putative integrase/recombinase [Actinomycetes bacterium]
MSGTKTEHADGPVRAGIWLRVSSSRQDEQNQLPDNRAWCDSHGYTVARTWELKGASAFKVDSPKFLRAWAEALAAFASGELEVLVIWQTSRLTRKRDLMTMIEQARDAGGRIECVREPHINDLSSMANRIVTHVVDEMNNHESEVKSERIIAAHDKNRARGSVNGRAPWGYEIKSHHGVKILKPTATGREWVPRIFEAAVSGKSLADIAAMLTMAGIPTIGGDSWSESTVRKLIARPTYHGGRRGKGQMDYEALVPVELWRQANMAIESRAKPGRGTTVKEPALLRPVCGACYGQERLGAPSGISPMYRVSRYGHDYYYCRGRGPARHSCGTRLIPMAKLDEAVGIVISSSSEPYREPVYIPGDDRAERLAAIQEKMAVASREGNFSLVADLVAEAREVESEPVRKARTEWVDTGRTIGQQWAALKSDRERREFLVTAKVRIIAELGEDEGIIFTVPELRQSAYRMIIS